MKMNNFLKASILCGFTISPFTDAFADIFHQDDVVIRGSTCIGVDCVNGENFGFDTIRLKENNLRIKFQDTSSTGGFPSRDWEIVANESANGGLNKFSINNVDNQQTPFTILDGVGNNALYIRNTNRVGFGTSTPIVNLHVVDGNSPALRLEQNQSAGFSAQTWDVAGNETNFFVRDVTNASRIPFKIQPSAPSNSIFVASDGDVGFETSSPDGIFDIAHPANLNNHAVLVSPTGNFGINIDNSFVPNGLLDVQTTGGVSRFTVASDGDVGIGTNAPTGRFEIKDLAGTNTYFNIGDEGVTTFKSSFFDNNNSTCATITCGYLSPVMTIEETNSSTVGRMILSLKNNGPSWFGLENTSLNEQWIFSNSANGLNFVYAGYNTGELVVPLQLFKNGDVKMAGTLYANSSRSLKENISEVNFADILERVDTLPVYTWNYIANKDDKKHMGPMAQDFYKLFGLGRDDEHISSLDVNGVSLAAIQALYAKIKKLENEVATLKQN